MHYPTAPHCLSHHLGLIVDPRMDRTKAHSLHDVLMISVLAMLCGAESFVDFEEFGIAKEEWLKTFLELPNGIPSHDTFGRVYSLIDQERFAQAFRDWTQELRKKITGEIVAIDGKTLRRSHDRSKNKSAIHMVSAWGRENGLVLGQVKVNEKSNEITAIPELLRSLELADCIVTIDAMGNQRLIAQKIVSKGVDYILSVKGNQGRLHDEVRDQFEFARHQLPSIPCPTHALPPLDPARWSFASTEETGHDRTEKRQILICHHLDWMDETVRKDWDALHHHGPPHHTLWSWRDAGRDKLLA